MKKIFKIIGIIILLGIVNVQASSNWFITDNIKRNEQSSNLLEEIVDIKNNALTFKITIPESCHEKRLVISPQIFDAVYHYKMLDVNNAVSINLIIENKSKEVYKYVDNSLFFSTKDYKYDTTKLMIGEQSFSLEYIVNKFIPYRVINTAIISLYDLDEEIIVSNDILDKKLKLRGYSGLSELDKYFLDYYNAKYNLDFNNLNFYNKQIINEIFTGKESNVLENNNNVITLGYNYYFNELLKVKLNNNIYSIGDCMRYYVDDQMFKDNFNYIDIDTTTDKVEFKLLLDDNYTDLFKNYLSGHLEFALDKSIYINPPNTGKSS